MKRMWIQSLIICCLVLISSTAHATGTQIRSQIAAVRIIVVDEKGFITQIYRNASQPTITDVRLLTADGPHITYTQTMDAQYKMIDQTLPKQATGKVYDRPKLPSLMEALYAMLKP